MKLDLDFMKNILLAIEGHSGSRMSLGSLLEKLEITLADENRLDVLAGHIRIMRDSGFIDSTATNCGFMANINNPVAAIHTGAQYQITMPGYQLLDGLRNDNLMTKVKSYFSEMGISGLKNAPGYLVGIAIEHMMKS